MRRQRIKLDRINKIFQDLQEQDIAHTVCTSNYLLGKLLTGQIHYAALLILSNPVNPVISSVLIHPGTGVKLHQLWLAQQIHPLGIDEFCTLCR